MNNQPSNQRKLRPKGVEQLLNRREFLIRSGLIGAASLTAAQILAACGGSGSDKNKPGTASSTAGTAGTSTATAGGGTGTGSGGGLYFENWPLYIDPTADGKVGTVDRFIKATGVDMKYTEAYNDNNEYFAKIQPVLGRGEKIGPDIIAPTSWMAGRLIGLGWLDKLPFDQVANASNLRDDLVKPAWDPTGEYSLPWQSGFAGIAYNQEVTGREIKSVDELFDPEFAGKVGALTEMRDTIGVIALSMGIDISNLKTLDEAKPAFDKLRKAKESGQIRRFHGNDYFDDMLSGNLAITIGWSGDVAQMRLENENIKFLFPPTGATSWADTMVLPKGAAHREAAAQWMNFVYDPVQAAQITAAVQYVSPVKGIKEEVAKIDPDLAANELVFPADETLKNSHGFALLADDVEAQFDAEFSSITGA